jgi:hypothetical protein
LAAAAATETVLALADATGTNAPSVANAIGDLLTDEPPSRL